MHAIDLITDDIPPLRTSDTIGRALDWMEEFKVSHLPVVENRRLVGIVQDSALVDKGDVKAELGTVRDRFTHVFVRGGQHIYDVMKVFTEQGLTIVPVLDDTGNFLGTVGEHEALRRLAEVANINQPGSVVVLEMSSVDYSLHEIARIVEGNDAKVLSVYTHSLPDSSRTEVTLKINREDISDVLQSFERYDYRVKSTYQGSRFHDDLRGRYDELMRYINL
ncbi:MAG: CBS domain-containing protein [Flavobacteriales bacterium]|nr:CBS domain-containing protein [Flavobacteriales bacterium]MBK7553061.1 CBS domain-containing protein [Flavobacteriales bacterium]MBK9195949.1 CBS domain-containing protein [Flavobacteriales bacterium]MBP6575003.1 CBS domain-containing protein [Flavobacteriales bacterium]